MRLIDADEMIKYLREFMCKDCDKRKGMKNGRLRVCYEIGDAPCRACDIGDTIDYLLDEAISPSVDAVRIVRCKDCKHYEDGTGICDLYHAHGYAETWYCADGQRR